MATTEELLKERGTKYGYYDLTAKIICGLHDVFMAHMSTYNKVAYEKLTDVQREGLHMIFHKLGRIANGDPNLIDSWADIAGYANLVADELQKAEDFKKITDITETTTSAKITEAKANEEWHRLNSRKAVGQDG